MLLATEHRRWRSDLLDQLGRRRGPRQGQRSVPASIDALSTTTTRAEPSTKCPVLLLVLHTLYDGNVNDPPGRNLGYSSRSAVRMDAKKAFPFSDHSAAAPNTAKRV